MLPSHRQLSNLFYSAVFHVVDDAIHGNGVCYYTRTRVTMPVFAVVSAALLFNSCTAYALDDVRGTGRFLKQQPAGDAFLSDLPLSVLATTPSALLATGPAEGQNLSVTGSQPIQVVFSRSVIQLGVDPSDVPPAQQPFKVGDGSVGRFRWMNSYIARFDPYGIWPSDLSLSFVWNRQLTSWEGLKLNNTEALRVSSLPSLLAFLTMLVKAKSANDQSGGCLVRAPAFKIINSFQYVSV
jgi:hypothetical protein